MTASKRVRVNFSTANKLPRTSVKRPLRLLKTVTLLTEVCAKAMLTVTFATNQTVQNMTARSDVCRVLIGIKSATARLGRDEGASSADGSLDSAE